MERIEPLVRVRDFDCPFKLSREDQRRDKPPVGNIGVQLARTFECCDALCKPATELQCIGMGQRQRRLELYGLKRKLQRSIQGRLPCFRSADFIPPDNPLFDERKVRVLRPGQSLRCAGSASNARAFAIFSALPLLARKPVCGCLRSPRDACSETVAHVLMACAAAHHARTELGAVKAGTWRRALPKLVVSSRNLYYLDIDLLGTR